MLSKLFKKDSSEIKFTLQWGGYYTFKGEDGTYQVWRLLDFNKDVLHYRMFRDHYDHMPILEEAKKAVPLIGHVPQASAMLLNEPITFLGAEKLTKEDLEGYEYYLKDAVGMSEDETKEFLEKIISFCDEAPAQITIARNPENPHGLIVKT